MSGYFILSGFKIAEVWTHDDHHSQEEQGQKGKLTFLPHDLKWIMVGVLVRPAAFLNYIY